MKTQNVTSLPLPGKDQSHQAPHNKITNEHSILESVDILIAGAFDSTNVWRDFDLLAVWWWLKREASHSLACDFLSGAIKSWKSS